MMSTPLTDQEVNRIAALIVQRLGVQDSGTAGASGETTPARPDATETLSHGLFSDVDSAVEAAKIGFRRLEQATLELREKLVAAMRASMLQESDALARLAHEETGLGRYEDKVRKNLLVTRKTPGTEALRPEALTGDHGLMLMEPAPYGVIGAITPMTNPSSTLICNAIGMVAAGNSVVFNVHPRAKRVGNRTVQLMNKAIMGAGGPANLITSVAEPSIDSAQRLMRHPDVRLLVVTGGPGVVREAMGSGKRAICAGPGNPPVVVDETADIAEAGRNIVLGASFDNNIICVDEKEVFVVDTVADDLLKAMSNNHAYVIGKADISRLDRVIFEKTGEPGHPGVINKDLIGKNAAVILSKLGIRVDEDTRLVVAEVPESHPLVWTEQMMPVLPVVRVTDAGQGIDCAVRAEQGNGHTAVMYSKHLDHLSTMARRINCSIFVKNAPCYAGLGAGGEGYSSFTIASPTGEGLTEPRSFTRQRRCVLVDHFRIV
jgi:aldehyde dehydrogenase